MNNITKNFIEDQKGLIDINTFENENRIKISYIDAVNIEEENHKILNIHNSKFCFNCLLEKISFKLFKCKKRIILIEEYYSSRQDRRMAFLDEIETHNKKRKILDLKLKELDIQIKNGR